jgi:hypothetical protein
MRSLEETPFLICGSRGRIAPVRWLLSGFGQRRGPQSDNQQNSTY